MNDPYVRQAQQDGYRSRAAYKLLEINAKHTLLRPGARVLDLGAAPGGWAQVAAAAVNAAGEPGARRGVVLGADLLAMDPIPHVRLLQLDFLDPEAEPTLRVALIEAGALAPDADRAEVDLVLSDMAAATTGHRQTDHMRIVALCEAAAEFARGLLAPNGAFVAKVLQGGAEGQLLAQLKRDFRKVVHVKPPASRKDSAETYLVATGFRGERFA
ncbi:MAG: RlmE family RNA methyltransferase [Pseudomonadota bacterium]